MSDPSSKRITYNDPGHAHELTFSVYGRQVKMFEPGVVEAFLTNLVAASEQLDFEIWAYVVMPDHVHLLLHPLREVYNMSAIRAKIKKPTAEAAFKLYPEWKQRMSVSRPSRGPSARFWQQGAGYDRNMYTPTVIRAAIEYIHQNPVRKDLAEAAVDWLWSSARNYAGLPGEIPVVLFSDPS